MTTADRADVPAVVVAAEEQGTVVLLPVEVTAAEAAVAVAVAGVVGRSFGHIRQRRDCDVLPLQSPTAARLIPEMTSAPPTSKTSRTRYTKR